MLTHPPEGFENNARLEHIRKYGVRRDERRVFVQKDTRVGRKTEPNRGKNFTPATLTDGQLDIPSKKEPSAISTQPEKPGKEDEPVVQPVSTTAKPWGSWKACFTDYREISSIYRVLAIQRYKDKAPAEQHGCLLRYWSNCFHICAVTRIELYLHYLLRLDFKELERLFFCKYEFRDFKVGDRLGPYTVEHHGHGEVCLRWKFFFGYFEGRTCLSIGINPQVHMHQLEEDTSIWFNCGTSFWPFQRWAKLDDSSPPLPLLLRPFMFAHGYYTKIRMYSMFRVMENEETNYMVKYFDYPKGVVAPRRVMLPDLNRDLPPR